MTATAITKTRAIPLRPTAKRIANSDIPIPSSFLSQGLKPGWITPKRFLIVPVDRHSLPRFAVGVTILA